MGGWTGVPHAFLDHYSSLRPRVTHGEAMLIIHLARHKSDAEAPFPGYARLARNIGLKPGAVRSLARSLEAKGYLFREMRPDATNKFHLDGLFSALERIITRKAPRCTECSPTGNPGVPRKTGINTQLPG